MPCAVELNSADRERLEAFMNTLPMDEERGEKSHVNE